MIRKKIRNNLVSQFLIYLKNLGIADRSLKHYKSDLSNFTIWIIQSARASGMYVESLYEALPLLNPKVGIEYKDYLKSTSNSLKTVNRRLSTVRQLSKFLIQAQVINFDIMKDISNESVVRKQPTGHSLLILYREHLRKNKVSHNTIKNYLSDIKQFISWIETRQA